MAEHVKTTTESIMSAGANNTPSQSRIYGYCVILVLIWASAFTLVGVAVPHITPIWLVTYRLIIGGAALTFYLKITGQSFPPLTDSRWLWYTGLGITGILLPLWLMSKGQLTIDSGLTAIFVGVMPLITIILAHFFTDERLTWPKFIGFAIGFSGIVLLFLPDDFSLNLAENWKAQLLIVAAATSFAVTTVAAKRAPPTPALTGSAMMFIGVAPFAIIAAFMSGVPSAAPASIAIVATLILALFSTAFVNVLYLHVIDLSGPSLLAKVNYFIPPVSIFLGITLLNEPFKWRMIIAFIIIVTGLIIARQGDKKQGDKKQANVTA